MLSENPLVLEERCEEEARNQCSDEILITIVEKRRAAGGLTWLSRANELRARVFPPAGGNNKNNTGNSIVPTK